MKVFRDTRLSVCFWQLKEVSVSNSSRENKMLLKSIIIAVLPPGVKRSGNIYDEYY
jgi:hypothetical protein